MCVCSLKMFFFFSHTNAWTPTAVDYKEALCLYNNDSLYPFMKKCNDAAVSSAGPI